MNRKEITRIVKKHTGVEHGAAAFNIAVDFAKKFKKVDQKGQITWSVAEDLIEENEEAFLSWIKDKAPEIYKHLRPIKIEQKLEEFLTVDKEIFARKNLNPDQRKKLDLIKKLKDEIDASGEEGYPFFTKAKEYGMIIAESNAMVKTGILKRRKSTVNRMRYVYSWAAGEADSKLLQKIEIASAELIRQQSRNFAAKKKAKKLAEKEARDKEALRVKTENLKPKPETFTHKSQGGAVLDPNSEWINNFKAKSEGLTSTDLDRLANEARNATDQIEKPSIQETQQTIEPKREDIPITVSVTTDGNKKTVSITIEV